MPTPILLIHGHPFDHTLWDPQAGALRDAGYQVIAPDLRGYGVRPSPVGEITLLADFAEDLAGQLDRHGVTRAVVGGVSMGGQIAMEFFWRYPDRVAGLVLADTRRSARPTRAGPGATRSPTGCSPRGWRATRPRSWTR